nr:SigB/SigF/SigG family RNA polymerase sigma factor [Actinoplanes durhamensis]
MAAVPLGHPARPELRAQAIVAWLPLAQRLAGRYAVRGEPREDLAQTAAVGLIKAIDHFDPGYGVGFGGYAIPTIVGEIKRYFRDRTWAVRVPRRIQELRIMIAAANHELTNVLCRAPTVADIAAHLGITEEEVLDGLEGARAYNARSLSAPAVPGQSIELGATLGGEDHEYAVVEDRIALMPALAALDDRERTIVTLRFYGNLSQAEIAGRVGCSQMHVSRLIMRSLGKLHDHLDAEEAAGRGGGHAAVGGPAAGVG